MLTALVFALAAVTAGSYVAAESIYDFKYKDIDGNEQSMDRYKDKTLLITNVASTCGKTAVVYPMLQKLFDDYKDKGFKILAFPCNQWAEEQLPEKEIKLFVEKLGMTFDFASKVDVNGNNAHPLWKYIKKACPSGLGLTNEIDWNFNFLLFKKDGTAVSRFSTVSVPGALQSAVKKECA